MRPVNLHSTVKSATFEAGTTRPPGSRSKPQRNPRAVYLSVLTWSFTLFNSIRVLAYLPTVLAIVQSGNSDQHSVWTWCCWVGANATMAGWLYEHNGQKINRAALVNMGNAVMCSVTLALIVIHRF
jgi:hypothetical protein